MCTAITATQWNQRSYPVTDPNINPNPNLTYSTNPTEP